MSDVATASNTESAPAITAEEWKSIRIDILEKRINRAEKPGFERPKLIAAMIRLEKSGNEPTTREELFVDSFLREGKQPLIATADTLINSILDTRKSSFVMRRVDRNRSIPFYLGLIRMERR